MNGDWIQVLSADGGIIDERSIMAVHIQGDGHRVALLWDPTKQMYAVVEVSVQNRIVSESDPIYGGQDAMNAYVGKLMKVFYTSENYSAPTLTYELRNVW